MKTPLADMCAIPWAMEPERLEALGKRLALVTHDDVLKAQAVAALAPRSAEKPLFDRQGSCAVVRISGTLMSQVPAWFSYFGIDATSYASIKAAVNAAAADPGVSTIVLRVSSHGGEAQGVGEVADAIYAARTKGRKRVSSVVEGIAASAAYWLTAMADDVTASPDAFVGSIGTYMVFEDSSKAAEAHGVKVHVIRAGEHKGAGEPGAPVTAAHLAGFQELVDGLRDLFVAGVAKGRKKTKSEIQALATGQVWLAAASKDQGLIDRVEAAGPGLSRIMKETHMADKDHEDALAKAKADTLAGERKRAGDLRAAFPKHPAFAAIHIELGSSVETAKAAFADELLVELEASNKALEAEKAKSATTPPAGKPARAGAPAAAKPVPRGTAPEDGEGEGLEYDFMAEARTFRAKNPGMSMTQAMRTVAARDPRAHNEWVQNQPKVPKGGERYARYARTSSRGPKGGSSE